MGTFVDSKIGLVEYTDNIIVSVDKVEFPTTLTATVFEDASSINDNVDEITTSLLSILKIPEVIKLTDLGKIRSQVGEIVVIATAIKKQITTISKYRNTEVVTSVNSCKSNLKHNLDLLIFSAKTSVENSIANLKTDYTAADLVKGASGIIDINNAIQDAYLLMSSLEEKVTAYLNILETLSSGSISAEVNAVIQENTCVAEAELDKISLKGCVKSSTGLVCELHVEIFSKLKKYGHYTPINYDGVEIELPEDIFLVKNLDNNEYGTLTCRDEPNETIQDYR